MQITTHGLIRWTGPAAAIAGISYVLVGAFHPLNVVEAATSSSWIVVHLFAMALSIFGLVGLTGLQARQAERSGWLGLAGYLLLSLWLIIILGFTFVEVFVLPALAIGAPAFVEGWMRMLNGTGGGMDLGTLPTLWLASTPLYLLGGVVFGISIFWAGILPRWAGALLAVGTAMGPLAAFLPLELQPKIAIPVGLALVWLGYALWSERHEKSSAPATFNAEFSHTLAR